jgi:4-amino-4-deoxy-L-arabinose transferase-like glycosyltransferase
MTGIYRGSFSFGACYLKGSFDMQLRKPLSNNDKFVIIERILIAAFLCCTLVAALLWWAWHIGHPTLAGTLVILIWLLSIALSGTITFLYPNLWPVAFLITLCLRIAAAAYISQFTPSGGDPVHYLNLAKNLAQGLGLVVNDPVYGKVQAFYPPIYPIILGSAGYLFGLSKEVIFTINTLIDIAASLVVFHIAQSVVEKRAAFICALIYFNLPYLILGASFPQKEGLALLLTLLVMFAYSRFAAGHSVASAAILLGLSAGTLILCQPAFAPFPVLVGLAFLRRVNPAQLARLALLSLPWLLLMLVPWWIRNYLIFGEFVPLTTAGGISLRVAIDGDWYMPSHLLEISEVERFKDLTSGSIAWALNNPLKYLEIVLRQCVGAFSREVSALQSLSMEWRENYALNSLAQASQFYWILLVVLCIRSIRAQNNNLIIYFVLMILLEIIIFNIWMEFSERHRYLLTPFLVLLAGSGICRSWKSRQDEPNLITDRTSPLLSLRSGAP